MINIPNIILIDDDEIHLFIMENYLNQLTQKLRIQSFTNGRQAVSYINSCIAQNCKLPDVIFLDINMPFLDGWGFLEEYKKIKSRIKPQIKIYMVSSSVNEGDIQRASKIEELSGYVIKPFQKNQLSTIVNEISN